LLGSTVPDPGCVVLNPIVVLRVAGETYREEAGTCFGLSRDVLLREVYDLSQPD